MVFSKAPLVMIIFDLLKKPTHKQAVYATGNRGIRV